MLELTQYYQTQENKTITAKDIFLRWEKLRIYYNLIITSVVILLTYHSLPEYIKDAQFLWICVRGFLIANICFTIGAAVNAYIHYMGGRHIGITITLFVIGTGLSVLMVFSRIDAFMYGELN
ncbi:MAG: hypothetical protein JW860_13215 [Sedimentisphaerales bacterium]|nr:hypothetical protein [Sedimentisphaerales bacterium]